MKDANGISKTDRDEIAEACAEYYEILYSGADNSQTIYEQAIIFNDNNMPTILKSEIRAALTQMKNGKAPGPDSVKIEILNASSEESVKILQKIYNKELLTQKIPKYWKNATIILLHKKGSKSEVKNYRPISLMPHIHKLYTKIIKNRIERTLNENQPPEQAAYRTGYSTTDHLHTIRQIMEKALEYKIHLYMAFIDYEKAYDSISHEAIFRAMRNQGIDQVYINIIRDAYTNRTAQIQTDVLSRKIDINKGVRQGDTLSPNLFTAALQEIFKRVDFEGKGIKIQGERLSNLRFADDIVLFSQSIKELQEMITLLNDEGKKDGMKLNKEKTKIMGNIYANKNDFKISVEGVELTLVESYTYLGQLLTTDNNIAKEISRRTGQGWTTFGKYSHLLNNTKTPICLKRKIMNGVILPAMTYGSQTWSLPKSKERD